MSQTILTNLCNILAHLYPDQPSIRRIIGESGIDLSHTILESNAKNNWHSVLVEANKLDQLDALLDVVHREYGSNKEFRDTYTAYYRSPDETKNSGLKPRMLGNTQNLQYSGGKSPVLQNVQNGDQKLGNIFRSHSQLFRRYAVDVLSKSLEYSNFTNQLDSIFLLADRVLVAFSAHIEFNRVTKVAETLAVIETGYNETGRDIDCEILLQSTEQWLKALLWLVDRSKWNALYQNKKRFTLFPCIRELGLLTQQELDTPEDEYRTIADDVRRLIYWNSKDRNYVTHETREAPEYIRSRYLPSALITLIAPICKHQGTIQENLKGLIASSLLEDPEIVGLIRLIDGERCNHLERFRARSEWIARLKSKLLDNSAQSKPYILLFGHEGMGKSALSAKLSDELALHNMDILGPAANEIRKIAPWLPGVILHFGKQSNRPDEIVRSLLSQINTLLLTPYELFPSLSQTMADHDSEDIIYHQMILPNQLINRATRSEIAYPEIRNPTNYLIVQRSASYLSNRESTFQHITITPELTQLRRVLHLALEQVGREYGPVVLIIDAVDEISADGTKLDFLPEYLPPNIAVLLTARRGSQAFSWLMSKRQCERIQLEYLTRGEIPELTGLQDSDGEKEAAFNTRLYKESQGWPVLVQAAIQTIPQHRANLAEIKISRSADSVFDRQAREWEQAAQKANDQTLVYLLHLLCIFEPAAPVDLEFVQSYLNYLGVSLRLAELRQILQPVHTQLEGIESGRLKLSLKAFAEYIREQYCSKLDLRQALEQVVEWLSTDQYLSAKLFASFLQFWTNSAHVKDDRLRTTSSKLVNALIARSDEKLLYEIFLQSFFSTKPRKKDSKDLLLPFAQTCLIGAAELDHLDAMRILGNLMIEGIGFKENQIKGEEWLRKAANQGDLRAKKDLGQRLLEGDGVKQDSIEGKQWLYSALEDGDDEAKGILATRLLNGDGLEKDTMKGEQMLRSLAASGDQKARLILANRLLEGDGLEKDPEEGEMLLEELVDSGNSNAIMHLADYLLNKSGDHVENERGVQLLRSLADTGDMSAIIRLSNYFLDTDGITAEQRVEGELLLKKAVVKDSQAKRIYAIRLLNGDGIIQNKHEGEKILIELANDGSLSAMTILGEYYLDAGMHKDGQRWLTKAAQEDHVPAMAVLGSRLLMGNDLSKNVVRGESWLRKAADMGHSQAMGLLGTLLLDGFILKQNLIEGKKWLRKAADDNEPQAMGDLGTRLLDGEGVVKDEVEGEIWLCKAADAGEPQAMRALGTRLLDGEGVVKDEVEGEIWLRKAADAGEPQAMLALASRLLDGEGLAKNEVEGEKWLRKAADSANPQAMVRLANRLLEADGLSKNVAEGSKWLRLAVEQKDEEILNDLLYSLRRARLSLGVQPPSINDLVADNAPKDSVNYVNYALCLADGFQCTKDWDIADKVIGKIKPNEKDKNQILHWWYNKLAQRQDDSEGHLVVGWLVRHQVIADPDGLTIQQRMQKARSGGWDVPNWMDLEASNIIG